MDAKILDPELRETLIALGIDPDEISNDPPEDLTAVPRDQWLDCTRVIAPPAILRYLQSGDTLTDHTIDMMELAIEKWIGAEAPWCITSMRDGREKDGDLAVRYFYLLKEV
jgi:hypothetical protein